MQGTVVQLNLSRGGLPKRPVTEAHLTPLGFEGDSVAHPNIHGGPQKAVLLIAAEATGELIARGYPLFYGALGENLTTRGIDRRQVRVGQRFRVGDAVVEITKARAPCQELDVYGAAIQDEIYDRAVKAGDAASPRWGLSGFYASVVRPGLVRTGDIISVIDAAV
jgi:MOSC domain-containing protein YiiM